MINWNLVKECLEELSDERMQRRLWLGPHDGLICTFEEAVCCLFDDSGLGVALDKRELAKDCGEREAYLFGRLAELVREIPSDLSPEQLISDPRMQPIRELSGDLLKIGRLNPS